MTPTKKFTVAEALKLAKQRISERRPDNALKIYNAILEALPDHQEARFGLIAVNDAINCDYFPPLDNQQISDLVKLAAPEASNALLTKLYNNHGKDVSSAFAQNLFGIAAVNFGNTEDALYHFRRAFALNPIETENFKNLCGILYETKSYEAGLDLVSEAKEFANLRFERLFFDTLFSSELNLFERADSSSEHLIEEFPKIADSWFAKGLFAIKARNYNYAVSLFKTYFSLGGEDAEAHHSIAKAYSRLGQFSKATRHFKKAVSLIPEKADFHFSLSLNLLTLGEYKEGFEEYEWRVKMGKASFCPSSQSEDWTGAQDLTGKSILVYHEQGLGDTLQFLRYVFLLKQTGVSIFLCVQSALVPLLSPLGLPVVFVSRQAQDMRFDYSVSLMSLANRFPAEIPLALNISEESEFSDKWQTWLSAQCSKKTVKKIGLCWRGNPSHENDAHRSMQLTDFLPLFDLPLDFITIQLDLSETEQAVCEEFGLHNPSTLIKDFRDTAGLIRNLDTIITVDTSVAHLSAGLGETTFLLLSLASDWRWGTNEVPSPWYPSASLFRQEKLGEWNAVICKVRQELLQRYID